MTESERLIENETEAIECLKSNKPTSGYVMLQESIDMAIQALEKQIPKKPNKTIDSSWGVKKEVHTCPVCDCFLTEVYFIAPQESKNKEKQLIVKLADRLLIGVMKNDQHNNSSIHHPHSIRHNRSDRGSICMVRHPRKK